MKTYLLFALAFALPGSTLRADVVAAEYYINVDPGPGLGSPVARVIPGPVATIDINVPANTLAALPAGTHLLTARVQDSAGNWSIAFTRPFLKEDPVPPSNPPAPVVAAEYYIDVDPGPGLGTPVAGLTPGGLSTLTIQVPPATVAALSAGTHVLTARVRDAAGNWSVAFARPFLKDDPAPESPKLATHITYQWHLNGTPVGTPVVLTPAAPAEEIGFDFLASLRGLTEGGTYQFVATPYDNSGTAGFSQTRLVKIETTDFDGDGLPDLWELDHDLNLTDPSDASLDSDGDGLSNVAEFIAKTHPKDADTSDDGLSDKFAIDLGLNPLASYPQVRAAILGHSQELGLASETQIRALSPTTPVLSRDPETGNFTLRIAVDQSTNLNSWSLLPLTVEGSSIDDGGLNFSFNPGGDTMFYRVTAGED